MLNPTSDMDAGELLQRLTLYAYGLFGCFPRAAAEPVLRASGKGPEDLAMDVLTRHFDPADTRVHWEPSRGPVLSYLKTVLWHDFLDLKRGGLYRSTTDTGDLDAMAAPLSTYARPDVRLERAQQRERVLAQLGDEPELRALAAQQLDPEGWPGYTNQELAARLAITVSEVENRKKRLLRRLLKIWRQQTAPAIVANH